MHMGLVDSAGCDLINPRAEAKSAVFAALIRNGATPVQVRLNGYQAHLTSANVQRLPVTRSCAAPLTMHLYDPGILGSIVQQ
jgi:hypothetical protein